MSASATLDRPAHAAAPASSEHDFDFLHGRWRVHNRRRRRPLTGSDDWYEFDGSTVERPLWGGRANVEEYDATLPDGTRLRGLALRLYDPQLRQWTIHWSNAAAGTLDAPMTGDFRHGRGEFYGHDVVDGRTILVRFVWTCRGPDAARWEQAFSGDAGQTWETNWIMDFTRARAATAESAVVELRRYTHHPGARDTLIELFEREFLEGQEATGMSVIAHFRDLDRPDVFTWLRGFPDMESRRASLAAFYEGPVWMANRHAANATLLTWDDVRLLRPIHPGTGFAFAGARPAPGAATQPTGLVVATVYTLRADAAATFGAFFEREAVPRLALAGIRPLALLETEPSENTYPRLPVRAGEHAFVWLAAFDDGAAHDRARAALAADGDWTRDVAPAIDRASCAPAEVWRLAPGARSQPLRCVSPR